MLVQLLFFLCNCAETFNGDCYILWKQGNVGGLGSRHLNQDPPIFLWVKGLGKATSNSFPYHPILFPWLLNAVRLQRDLDGFFLV